MKKRYSRLLMFMGIFIFGLAPTPLIVNPNYGIQEILLLVVALSYAGWVIPEQLRYMIKEKQNGG